MNLAFYISNQREAILEGYLQLAQALPKDRWLITKPQALRDEVGFPDHILEEPDWYSWRKNPLALLKMLGMLFKTLQVVNKHKVRCVFLYGIPSPWTFLLRTVLYATGVRWVLFIHDPKLHEGERIERRLISRLYEAVMMRPAAALVVSYSQGMQELLNRGIGRPDSIHVLPLPMLTSMEKAEPDVESSDFLFFGRLEMYKGIDLLEQVIELLDKKNIRPKVLVVGRGPLSGQVDGICAKFPHVKRIEGYLPNETMAGLVAATKCLLLPYRDATGSHNVQIANHHGVPVVATKVGCFKEYVLDGVNGLLVEPGDAQAFAQAVEKILEIPRAEWLEGCMNTVVKNHSSDIFAKQIDHIASCGGMH